MSNRGGMSKNAFIGKPRLDKLGGEAGFTALLGPNDPKEKAIILTTFSEAVNSYLMFGFGRNGTCVSEFWQDYQYLFKIRSYIRETWSHTRLMKDTSVDEETGLRRTKYIHLTDIQLKLMCADVHFGLLDFNMPFSEFCADLKAERARCLDKNAEQWQIYIDYLRECQVTRGTSMLMPNLLRSDTASRRRILIEPDNPEEVAELVYYDEKKRQHTKHIKTLKPTDWETFEATATLLDLGESLKLDTGFMKGPFFETFVHGTIGHLGGSHTELHG